jgi:peptidoglycan/xylan/chitin deacetylase (PgdA/CDA1 family)
MTGRRQRRGTSASVNATVPFRVMKFSPERHEIVLLRFGEWTTSTAANLYDVSGRRLTAIRQPNARYGQPWDEDAFRAETRRFVQEFNARSVAAGAPTVARITWLVRDRPAGDEDVA